mmetsp:Transcript_37095/g.44723  ORF Transcript_37095/g.44723 Transcript_37095/m.44723 type:complete len:119 (-) Transcript_37095:136-492(-)
MAEDAAEFETGTSTTGTGNPFITLESAVVVATVALAVVLSVDNSVAGSVTATGSDFSTTSATEGGDDVLVADDATVGAIDEDDWTMLLFWWVFTNADIGCGGKIAPDTVVRPERAILL